MHDLQSFLAIFNFIDAAIFTICGLVVVKLLWEYKHSKGIKSFKQCIQQIWLGEDGAVRPALGFLFLCLGVVIGRLIMAPVFALGALGKFNSFDDIYTSLAPVAYAGSTFCFSIAAALIMWPTLEQLAITIFGSNLKQKELVTASIGIFAGTLLLLGFIGYLFQQLMIYALNLWI